MDNLHGFNWHDVQVFVATSDYGSFRTAADRIGISYNTVRRHIERLEKSISKILIVRHPNGFELTADGHSLRRAAQAMQIAASTVERASTSQPTMVSGRVKVSITEGLGTFWLMPRLVKFQRGYPSLIVEANCTFREADVAKMEADISVQLTKPTKSDVKFVKLGCMHAIPFGAPSYFNTYGMPRSISELGDHKIVEQLTPQIDINLLDRMFPNKSREGFVSIATNTSTAHFWSVVSGGGVGVLPTYLVWLGANIKPVEFDLTLKHEIWLAYHQDARKQKGVSIMIDWLRENFNPTRFPWFGEKFIHPKEYHLSDDTLIEDNHLSTILARP